jgi:ferrous iron transport protein B
VAKEVVVASMAQSYGTEDPGVASASTVEPGATQGATAAAIPSIADDLAQMGSSLLVATQGALGSTLGIIPGLGSDPSIAAAEQDTGLSEALATTFTPLSAVAFILFVLVYTPCVATLAAIRSEFGGRWAAFSGLYQLALAWLLAVLVFQVGTALGYA